MKVSVLLPAFDDHHNLLKQLSCIEDQTYRIHELIVVDSSSNDLIRNCIQSYKGNILIKYFKPGHAKFLDRYRLILEQLFSFSNKSNPKKNYRLYPSEATNFASKESTGDVLAFLDMSTFPEKNWISNSIKYIEEGYDLVFGKTKYKSQSIFQNAVHLSTFGKLPQESNPGTLIKKSVYEKNPMLEGVRAGADLEWRDRMKKSFRTFTPNIHNLVYSSLPKSLISFLKKMFIYQMHSALVNIQINVKDIFFAIFLILSSLVVSRWNHIVGWESVFFIPHITKVYLIVFCLFFLQLLIFQNLRKRLLQNINYPATSFTLKLILFSAFFLLSYRWNALAANWIEESRLYIPHLTQIFLLLSVITAIIYRGVYFPISTGIYLKEILPFKWLFVGVIGFLGDIVKAPGFIIGSIIYLLAPSKKW